MSDERPHMTLSIFRVVGGRRIPYILVLDTDMTVLKDEPDQEKLLARVPPPSGKVITPTATDIVVGKWATALVADNPIPGTDELRREFFEAEQAIRDRHAADGTVCRPCEIGTLIRKYRSKLEAQGFLK